MMALAENTAFCTLPDAQYDMFSLDKGVFSEVEEDAEANYQDLLFMISLQWDTIR